MPDLYQTLQQIARNAVSAEKPVEILFGRVQSLEPFQVKLSQKLTLGKAFLTVRDGVTAQSFQVGDKLILFRFQGGQKYLILDKAGEL